MKTTALSRAVLVLMVGALFGTPLVRAGLYDDDPKSPQNVTKGDLDDQDYWWAKYDAMMLELAIKQKQPEGRIAVDLASSIKRLDDLVAKYPKHEEIKKWKDRADEVNKKIDPNANRQESFRPDCPWDESNFAQLWVNLQWAKVQADAKEYDKAYGLMQNVETNYEIMMKPGRMKEYPEELSKWVTDHKKDADALYAEMKKKSGNG